MYAVKPLLDRTKAWHELRSTGKVSTNLTSKLLIEEFTELLDASNEQEYVDALGDIAFVAAGSLVRHTTWNTQELALMVLKEIKANTSIEPTALLDLYDAISIYTNGVSPNNHTTQYVKIISLCFVALEEAMHTASLASQVVLAICDSNDSKSLNRIAPGEKYSSEGKGPNYKSPEQAIKNLIKDRDTKVVINYAN